MVANLRIKASLALGKRLTSVGHLPQVTNPLHSATHYFQYPK